MAFDTMILKVQLDEGVSHLTNYKIAVNYAAEELLRMVSDAIPNHFNRDQSSGRALTRALSFF